MNYRLINNRYLYPLFLMGLAGTGAGRHIILTSVTGSAINPAPRQ
ncbi:MAG: hypothetical protein WCO44_02215 [Bacteroidota bacterium]